MANVNTGSLHPVVTPAVGQFQANHQLQGNSYNSGVGDIFEYSQWGISSVTENESFDGTGGGSSGSWTRNTGSTLTADENYQFRAKVDDSTGTNYGSTKSSRTAAMAASITSNPAASNITASSVTIDASYIPRTLRGSCSGQLQYKKNTDVSWTNAGSADTTGGYGTVSPSRNVTGLEASTLYNMRLVITRTTANDTSLISSTVSFTTLAGEPLVTTEAATGVAASSAVLHGTLDINEGTGVNVYFKWDTVTPPVANTTANQSESADTSFEQAISGLSANTLYYFQAFVSFSTPSGSPNEGSILSFTTPNDPAAEAADEDHMQTFEFNERKYGVQSTFYFTVASPAATSSDRFFNAASPFAAGDVQLSKDGAAFANVGTLPTRVGSTAVFSLTLDATEMQFTTGIVQIVDQDGPAFRDAVIVIRTKQQLGQVDIDASQLTNTTAFTCTGVGSGHGASFVGGATGLDIDGVLGQHVQRSGVAQAGGASQITLDASASSTNDYYNGSIIMIVGGTGAGQARVITDYVGSTAIATVDSSWSTNPASGSVFVIVGGDRPWDLSPATELASVPAATANYGQKLQAVFQRFFFKRTQTVTTQTLFKSDSSTTLGTATVSDDGATQSSGKIS